MTGLAGHRGQTIALLVQVFLVGVTLGTMRTVVPALGEAEFGVPRGSIGLLVAFIVAFGLVKGTLNFVAGHMSELYGRKPVLVAGWLFALPVPVLVWAAPSWNWIIAATVLLGVNQGLAWSMSQTAKLDYARADQRGLAIGLNEFAGYGGVAVSGIAAGYLAEYLGARTGILLFGSLAVLIALGFALMTVAESRPSRAATADTPPKPSTREVFARMTWRDRRLVSVVQAGLVEKFVDALVWVAMPVYLYDRGQSLGSIGWIVSCFVLVWGGSQFITGPLSDRIGRQIPNVGGMWLCGLGVALFPFGETVAWWGTTAALSGFGMALLYPNLSASISDLAAPEWRGTAIGIYRFWRDLGYSVGALAIAAAAASGAATAPFIAVGLAMAVSGAVLWWGCGETHAVENRGRAP